MVKRDPEVVLRAQPGADLREVRAGCATAGLTAHASVEPVFPGSLPASGGSIPAPDLAAFYRLVPDGAAKHSNEDIAATLENVGAIAEAWVWPALLLNTGLPAANFERNSTRAVPKPQPTPDFYSEQRYLGPVEQGGVGAAAVWDRVEGALGAGVGIIDVEREWCPAHEDLLIDGFVIDGRPSGDKSERNHGTSVVGVIAARHGGYGTRGLCPEATVKGISIEGGEGRTVATAIWRAANLLRPGDIMLLEMQAPGPNADRENPDSQKGWLPIEWWPAERAAVQFAVNRGVIVVGAAGNGEENLDADDYEKGPGDFQGQPWRNAFRGDDSGAILVGAGAPPHWSPPSGWTGGPDRSRMPFSNYGRRVDTQAWGSDVVTTGGLGSQWDDLFDVPEETRWYTSRFSGTSSAAAIVTGVLGCVQGALRAAGHAPLEPLEARSLLRECGSGQEDAPGRARGERIGPRVSLPELIETAMTWRSRPRPNAGRLAGSNPMSSPSTVYNFYFGDGASSVLQLDPTRFRVSQPMDASLVDLTQVKGPGAFVVHTGENQVVLIHLGAGAGAPELEVDISRMTGPTLNAATVDLTQVKGPAALVVPAGPGRVTVLDLTAGG